MNIRPKVRNAALVGALAAITATAWATSDSMSSTTATTSDAIVVNDSLSPNESVVTTSETKAIPVVDRSVQPPITVETQRLSEDQRIQMQVMDKLASNEHLSGKIGVESNDAVVRLSGYTSTVGQAWRAGRDAGSIVGVKYVQNEIRPRVGGSVS
jgi:hyperosmotically inducible periplasmic protein